VKKRICSKCGIEKPESKKFFDFISQRNYKGFAARCVECRKKQHSKNYHAHKKPGTRTYNKRGFHQNDEYQLLYKYGMSIEDFKALKRKQGSRCALCGTKGKRLVVDHDHATDKVRGLLCYACNSGLGLLGDTISAIRAALDYLNAVASVEQPVER